MTEIIYDATVAFCKRFISKFSRTRDQMVQAARSGNQNIAEGSMASGGARTMKKRKQSESHSPAERRIAPWNLACLPRNRLRQRIAQQVLDECVAMATLLAAFMIIHFTPLIETDRF